MSVNRNLLVACTWAGRQGVLTACTRACQRAPVTFSAALHARAHGPVSTLAPRTLPPHPRAKRVLASPPCACCNRCCACLLAIQGTCSTRWPTGGARSPQRPVTQLRCCTIAPLAPCTLQRYTPAPLHPRTAAPRPWRVHSCMPRVHHHMLRCTTAVAWPVFLPCVMAHWHEGRGLYCAPVGCATLPQGCSCA